jgi:creatinine deaminase
VILHNETMTKTAILTDQQFLKEAFNEALESYREGGIPIGAVMVENGDIIGRGHNQRVQFNDPIAHGEMDCIRKVGRRASYNGITLYTTLSPCMMCAGTIIQFGIPRVVVGENLSFKGNLEFLQSHGVDVMLLNDPSCHDLMQKFIQGKPLLWLEDIAGRDHV